ncbi:MAG TPA: ATP:cob(I)alamin adenosyltransferase, partial [Candidatus Marinimicrobia bacterium]|nr:ATP:cob(I)alamin adenosyltransferase [Candidatus Neomarinimicrobiota bacterium]
MRITKVYTRTGDDGTTGLAKGERLSKDSPRIVAFGALDEINASIGVCLSESLLDEISGVLKKIQHVLFNIGGELAVVDEELNLISQDDINDL